MGFLAPSSSQVQDAGFSSRKQGFESPWGQFLEALAQLVEQFPFKEWVEGSSPSSLNFLSLR